MAPLLVCAGPAFPVPLLPVTAPAAVAFRVAASAAAIRTLPSWARSPGASLRSHRSPTLSLGLVGGSGQHFGDDANLASVVGPAVSDGQWNQIEALAVGVGLRITVDAFASESNRRVRAEGAAAVRKRARRR